MANEHGEGTYVCTLSPALIQKAETELSEKPQWRAAAIEAFRKKGLENKGKVEEIKAKAYTCNIKRNSVVPGN